MGLTPRQEGQELQKIRAPGRRRGERRGGSPPGEALSLRASPPAGARRAARLSPAGLLQAGQVFAEGLQLLGRDLVLAEAGHARAGVVRLRIADVLADPLG